MAIEGNPSLSPPPGGVFDLMPQDDDLPDIVSFDEESLSSLPPFEPLTLVPEAHPEKHGAHDEEHGLWTLGGPRRESQKLHRLTLCPPDPTASFEVVDEQGVVVIALPQVPTRGTVGPTVARVLSSRHIRCSTACVGGSRNRRSLSFGSDSSASGHCSSGSAVRRGPARTLGVCWRCLRRSADGVLLQRILMMGIRTLDRYRGTTRPKRVMRRGEGVFLFRLSDA